MGAVLPPRPEHDPGGSAILLNASVLPVRTCDAPGASERISDLFDPAPVGTSWPVLNARSCKPLLARACSVIFMMSLVWVRLSSASPPGTFDSLMQSRFGRFYQDRYRFAVDESDSVRGVFRAIHEDGFGDIILTVTDSLPPFFSFHLKNEVRSDEDSDLKAVSTAWRAGLASAKVECIRSIRPPWR